MRSRRPFFRQRVNNPFRPERNPHPLLIQANLLFEEGRYAEAADLFELIAKGALERGGPRAPYLLLRAGKACLLAGLGERGMGNLIKALGILASEEKWLELSDMGNAIVEELKRRDKIDEANEIEDWLVLTLPRDITDYFEVRNSTRTQEVLLLPPNCPSCGAPVNPHEAEWVDDFTAICKFCGTYLRKKRYPEQ